MYPRSHPSVKHAEIASNVSFPDIEKHILEFWNSDHTFRDSITARDGDEEWVFYDGPPFANGLPHYGHLLTGYAKDVFPRYQTMRGKRVDRRFGWDTHGLPAELEAMRQLGITTKGEIEEMGIEAFNAEARSSVLRYTDEWRTYVTRQARWVDFDNDYKTLDISFMESVLWAFKQLYDKGLAYEGFRVLPYCWNDETPLSNHELRMDDDVYKMRQDQSVTVTFELTGERAEQLGLLGVNALAWTTTPWTLPTNAALAVGPEITYLVVPAGPAASDPAVAGISEYLIAQDLVGNYLKELGYQSEDELRESVSRSILGEQLAGVTYQRLWDYYEQDERYQHNAWRILPADFVTIADGTGIVHLAPAFGEDDQRVCEEAGIPVIVSVDDGGRFLPQVHDVAGMHLFDANKELTRLLREQGRLFRVASYEHSYPHCWRCRQPLIYRAVSSWFVKVLDIRDRMEQLNQEINWVPENVKDGQFGKWLSNARDWSISRNRYWGSPIPVWKSDNPEYPRVDVYGSLDELERDFGVRPTDLHRPFIDELTRPNPDDPTGQSTMRRIEDVLDVWFDSGSMPFAQVHYPFENGEWFDEHNPADFIVEYIGQTRGWFYTLHVLSTALFDRPAFRNVISHGIVLGNDGQKMSKSLRNYPDVAEVFERDGSDAMRWFLMSSPVLRGGNLIVTEEGIREGVRQLLLPLWNSFYFFSLYANAENYQAKWRTDSTDVLDQYILAKTRALIETVQEQFDQLDATAAAATLREFADVLTNWYVRRSRTRFWEGGVTAQGSFDTLYTVLETLCRVTAPLLPLVTEYVWQALTGDRSVHLTDWPKASSFHSNDDLVKKMDAVRDITSTTLALRKKSGLRVRLPLNKLTVISVGAQGLAEYADILREELNVKSVELVEYQEDSAQTYGISQKLAVNARVAGPRLGKDIQRIIHAAKSGNWESAPEGVSVDGVLLHTGEYDVSLEVSGLTEQETAMALLPRGGFVMLDTTLTVDLEAEGLTRDLIRAVQDSRKAAGFDVSDRINLALVCCDLSDYESLSIPTEVDIAGETLATRFELVHISADSAGVSLDSTSPVEWLPREAGFEPEHFTVLEPEHYANRGKVVIALSRVNRVLNV